jgi:hypothetical protein
MDSDINASQSLPGLCRAVAWSCLRLPQRQVAPLSEAC